ncbi:toll-like receptor 13 [Mytilus galloprovincialis]|uniref:Toll-like receptor 13 n=2 Tax=Mytilus galloprovincialis TaxID=29158 RepID=A0A8B6G637_MYTGA|nr:toll-like receptor 13 [Mytilus galloprovincialis]
MEFLKLYFFCFIWYNYIQVRTEKSDVPCLKKFCSCSRKHSRARCNRLMYIPRVPSYVVILEMENNFLSHISMGTFRNVSNNNLTGLTFINNSIEVLTVDAFKEMNNLRHLKISHEFFLNVSSLKMSFKNLNKVRMQTMYFINNGWTMLPLDFFSDFRNHTLVKLSLDDNILRNFNGSQLLEFSEIHTLSVERNELVIFNASGLHTVHHLVLISNNLFEIPNFCSNETGQSLVPKLSQLNLKDNAIRKLGSSSFKCLENLRELILDENRVLVLKNDTFSRLTNLKTLLINRMPHLSTIEPTAFRCPSLEVLKFVQNEFYFVSSTKNKTFSFDPSNLFKHARSLKKVDLTRNHMTNNPGLFQKIFYPLTNLTELNLQATYIRMLPERVFQRMPFLKTLHLKGNRITTWNQKVFENLTSLRNLYMDGNHIRVINESSFPIKLLRSLEAFDISFNKFWCTCAQKWFVDYLRSSNISKILKNWPQFYMCDYPDYKRGVLLIKYKPTDAECATWSPIFTVIIVIVVSIFLVIVVLFLMFNCQANIRNLIYLFRVIKRKRKGYIRINTSESFEYDAFVIYCDSDRQWVHLELLKHLEGMDLKVCIHHRDFDVGEHIIDNITKYVGKSWKVVIVMSNNFTKSEWCQWELDLVQERRRRHGKDALVLIMYSQIDSSHMTNSIRSLLDTTPHLRYQKGLGEDLFWSAFTNAVRKPFEDPPTAIL